MKQSRLARQHVVLIGLASILGATATGCTSRHFAGRDVEHCANWRIIIPAQPEPMSIDTAKTAVIVVDMQNDFGAKGGMFDRAGIDITGDPESRSSDSKSPGRRPESRYQGHLSQNGLSA